MIIVKEKKDYKRVLKPQIIIFKHPLFVEIVFQMTPEFIQIARE